MRLRRAGLFGGASISISQGLIADLLGFFAGSFLFIGATHLLPEAEEEGDAGWLFVVVVADLLSCSLSTAFSRSRPTKGVRCCL